MSDTSTKRDFANLTATNYNIWSPAFEAYLKVKGLYPHITGAAEQHLPTPDVSGYLSPAERKELRDYERERDQAAGFLYLCVEQDQRDHFRDIESDPLAMWKKLRSVHVQQKAGNRFTALDQLFAIQKEENESLTTLMGRTSRQVQEIRALWPPNYDLKTLIAEIEMMAMLRALPAEYDHFVTSLLLTEDLTLDKLKLAYQNEETQRASRESKVALVAAAAATPVVHAHAPASGSVVRCSWCLRDGHSEEACQTKQFSQKKDRERAAKPKTLWKKSANAAAEVQETASQEPPRT